MVELNLSGQQENAERVTMRETMPELGVWTISLAFAVSNPRIVSSPKN